MTDIEIAKEILRKLVNLCSNVEKEYSESIKEEANILNCLQQLSLEMESSPEADEKQWGLIKEKIAEFELLAKKYVKNLQTYKVEKNNIYDEIEKLRKDEIIKKDSNILTNIYAKFQDVETQITRYNNQLLNCHLNFQKWTLNYNDHIIKNILNDTQQNLEDLKTKNESEIILLKEASARELNSLRAKNSEEIKTLKATTTAQLETLKTESKKEINILKQDIGKDIEKEIREVKDSSIRSLTGFFFIFTLIASNIGLIFKASESLTALCFVGLALMINSIILFTAVMIFSVINKNSEILINDTKEPSYNLFKSLEFWIPLIGIIFGLGILFYDNINGDKEYIKDTINEKFKEENNSINTIKMEMQLKQIQLEEENKIIKSENEYILKKLNEMEKKVEVKK